MMFVYFSKHCVPKIVVIAAKTVVFAPITIVYAAIT